MKVKKLQLEPISYMGYTPDSLRKLINLRPNVWKALDSTTPEQILYELVNLPLKVRTENDNRRVQGFMKKYGVAKVTVDECSDLAGLFRQFWSVKDDGYRAHLLVMLLGPRLDLAMNNPVAWRDYTRSGIAFDWQTGQFCIRARGLQDVLLCTIYNKRHSLRQCRLRDCKKYFVSSFPNERGCSSECKALLDKERKRKSWHKNHSKKTNR